MTNQSINTYLDSLQTDHALSACVSVTRGGDEVYAQSFGFADRVARTPVTRRTRFRIASVTKQFTAYVVLKTFEEQGLSLDTNLAAYYPAFSGADRITMRQLLQHTAGIPSDNVLPDYASLLQQEVDVDALLARFEVMELLFEPGERFSYGNTAYVLLGRIVEKLHGKALDDVYRAMVFDPLGMVDTSLDASPGHARGYQLTEGAISDIGEMNVSLFFAAGGLYSTVDDLDRWCHHFYGPTFLSPTIREQMFGQWVETGAAYRVGLAVASEVREGRQIYYIGGGVPGFSSITMRSPADDIHVNILSNFTFHKFDAMAFELIRLA